MAPSNHRVEPVTGSRRYPVSRAVCVGRVSEQHGFVTERHPQFAGGTIDVDAELVREPQHLALAELDQHHESPG